MKICETMVTCESDELVGRRVAVGNDLATVRYVGPVSTAKGTWLGLEWDDPQRGKHDGTYNGHRYFVTRHPTSGSFIHIEKADLGRSFVSALKERYASNQLTLPDEELQELQKAMNAPLLEMVGFDKVNKKQSCFSDLDVISVHNHRVYCAGGELASLHLKASDVDLSLNLLSSWDEVANIIGNIDRVNTLNVSLNKLSIPNKAECLRETFKHLSHLVMGHMEYSWEQILTCSQMWPDVQELQVPFNSIISLSIPDNTLRNLTHLDIEGNSIPDWEEINKLGVLEKLNSLNLCNLGLTNIKLPPSQKVFQNLECLLLSDNKIAEWQFVSQLGLLPKLKELRFSNNPVQEKLSVERSRYNIIARIGTLEILNRKVVAREDRRGAEIDYVKDHGKLWFMSLKNQVDNSQFLAQHPRFPDLAIKFELREEETADVPENSRAIKLKLSCGDKTITKTLPKSISINQLNSILRKAFKFGPIDPTISYRSWRNPNVKGELSSLYQTLDYYSLEDGDEIFCDY